MYDRLLAALSFTGLAAFCAIFIWYVNRLDLTVVMVIVLLMALYDFIKELRQNNMKTAAADAEEQHDQI